LNAPPHLLVEFHLTGGQIDRYEIPNPELATILAEQLNPAKVFTGGPISISESRCLTSYRMQDVTRIDVSGPGTPKWPYMGGASSITEVTENDFEHLCGSDDLAQKRIEAWKTPGSTQQGFTVLTLSSGKRIIWQVDMVSAEMVAMDAMGIVRHLLSASALHGRRADGAAMIINMTDVTRLEFFPGPPKTAARVPFGNRL
jgi:hypothetical protein